MPRRSFRRTVRLGFFTVLAVGLAATASGIGRATPAAANTNPNPYVSVAVDSVHGAFEEDVVAWMCPGDLGLCLATNNSQGFNNWHSGQIPNMGSLTSEPTVALDLNPNHIVAGYHYDYVFWRGQGPAYNLMEAYWNGSWHGPFTIDVGPLGSAPSTPSAYATGGSTEMIVGWKGTGSSANLWYTHSTDPSNPSSWSGAVQRDVGPLGSAPALVNANAGGDIQVSAWWMGTDQNLWAASIASSDVAPWGPCNFHMGPLGSPPSLAWNSFTGRIGPLHEAPNPTGNCPPNAPANPGPAPWFGNSGEYNVCWGANTGNGFWCMGWYVNLLDQATYLVGPQHLYGGNLGSAPAVAAGPAQSSNNEAYWAGSTDPFNPDLWMTGEFVNTTVQALDTGVKLGAH